MEKKNSTRLKLLILGMMFISQFAISQIPRKEYTINEMKATGLKNFSEKNVISYSGLRKGQKITLPGEEISETIKKLWGLNLFSNINIYVLKIDEFKVDLEINITELPTLNYFKITGVKRKEIKEINADIEIKKGKRIDENFISSTKLYLKKRYLKKGFFEVKITISTRVSNEEKNYVDLAIRVDKGKRVKVNKIELEGTKQLSKFTLKKALKIKRKNFFRFYKRSKFVDEDYQTGKINLIDKYKEKGFRDARIVSDSVYKVKSGLNMIIRIEEGKQHYFGDIVFLGNSVYKDAQLKKILRIKKGGVYNGVLLKKRIADDSKPDSENLKNLYQNSGYLFSNIESVETQVRNDTIDFEIRIIEGKPAYFNNILIKGNTRTNDYVIYRELRTKPGQLYKKDNVVRSVRELSQLQYFDPEKISPDFKNVEPNSGTLDLEYSLEEKGSSQIELQGGYGGTGFVGTVGLAFNNFAIKDIFNGEEYKPVPLGDGQRLALRLQASNFFTTYSLSFSEPWLGGKKPISFSTSFSYSEQFLWNSFDRTVDDSSRILITSLNIGLGKRLRKPDDYFTLSHLLGFKYYDLKNYQTALFSFGNGYSNALSYLVELKRNSSGPNPIYPMGGSNFLVSATVTPPYSLFTNVDYGNLKNLDEYKRKDSQGFYLNSLGERVSNIEDATLDEIKLSEEKFRWLEFFKLKFKGEWFLTLVDKLVFKSNFEAGFLSAYNNGKGDVPFERFFVGGDGLNISRLDGRETIQLRGYSNQSLSTQDGSTIYNKLNAEIRYPFALKPSASIYGLGFVEGGAGYNNFSSFNPFKMSKSAGFGIRIFMPAFGLLGFDFAYGYDSVNLRSTEPSGWQTHFIIGQQF